MWPHQNVVVRLQKCSFHLTCEAVSEFGHFSATFAFTNTKKMTDFNPAVTVLFEQKLTVCHVLSDRLIRITGFVGLTSLRRHLSAGVQFSSVLQRPKPSRCLSGCPGRRDG